ncbi:adenylate/guanylate cyclase domain-containing protein [Nocardioides marmoriginsengisoli]|uniref:Adenylate/guanylate cyclase domain-containing protein n=1 Tax=Nocardioides marmoriginsengisoli TaxID=661483 RepID=A0A3N0CNR3_9ACTN|nr:adenylate/guanylate cyclase domain-containing protein [Nocardioides marmoriginsengisoli]RNL65112.1 adenylate/guanylate cyclase domain-containing protein [Nocardioides marmoriginsengisoli]
MPPPEEKPPLDPQEIFELLELHLLGSHPTMTGAQIAAEIGIPMELARLRWRSLGFTAVGDDEVAFTEADLQAMRLTQRMHDLGLIQTEDEAALIRTLGRSFARLAEWQITMLARSIDPSGLDGPGLTAVMDEVTPVIEEVQNYIWRRHTLSAASRMLLAPPAEDAGDEIATAIGFADIVGYTRQTRSLSQTELARLVDHFEARALAIITSHQGRIIKTIGDEILFAADAAADAAHIALELVEEHLVDEDFPQLRVGVGWGPVLNRLGDVFGPTVNIASRLTSIARPGRVLIDKELAEAIEGDPDFKLRRTRRASVKGYRRLEPWALRRPLDEGDLPPVAAVLHEKGQDLLRAVDEMQARTERTPAAEAGE